MSNTIRHTIALAALAGVAAMAPAAPALAAERPVKEILERQIGWEVNRTTKGKVCLVESEECQSGAHSGQPGGFEYPVGVASGPAPEGHLYVADQSNSRIQTFTPQGAFVSMFGWDVDKTKTEAGAPQAERNVCTAESHDVCQPGQPVTGGPAGQIALPRSIAADRTSGEVYVLDWANRRIEKYTPAGEFVLMIGGKVNRKGGYVCTSAEANECQAGAESAPGCTEPGAFKSPGERGDLLAVGPGGILYVGDEGCVQEFEADGKYLTKVLVAGRIEALAVDATGETYLTDELPAQTIYKFTAARAEVKDEHWPLKLKPREQSELNFAVGGLAVDRSGRLATTGFETYEPNPGEYAFRTFGLLLDGGTGEQITEFRGSESFGVAFGASEVGTSGGFELYVVDEVPQRVLIYRPVAVGELITKPAICTPGPDSETDATFDCTLNGEVNPWEVVDTEFWFEWGRTTGLGTSTEKLLLCSTCGSTRERVSEMVEGVPPNEATLYGRLAVEDANARAPEQLLSDESRFATPSVPPRVLGESSASFVHASSVVMFGELNPENAKTTYFFEYAPGEKTLAERCPKGAMMESCEGVAATTALESSAYGAIGVTAEAVGLQPEKPYRYRLSAVNDKAEAAEFLPEGEGAFTTAPAPKVLAETGSASSVTSTSALVSGAVNPDGQAAAYVFELGLYNGAGTQYGVVFSGPVRASVVPVPEQLQLTGLQPGTTYAYRIAVKSGYGESTGATATFSTQGLPSVLSEPSPLVMLAMPKGVAFPVESTPPPIKCKHGYKHDKHGRCLKTKSARRRAKGRKARWAGRHAKGGA